MGKPAVFLVGLPPAMHLLGEVERAVRDAVRISRSEADSGAPAEDLEALSTALDAPDPPQALLICLDPPLSDLPALIAGARQRAPELPILTVLNDDEPEVFFELLRLGVDDFVTPPLHPGEILPRLWRLIAPRDESQRSLLRLREKLALRRLIGSSAAFLAVVERIPLLARCDSTVLLSGETGTGKEVVSRAIHYLSWRADGPFVPVNCGAIPTELVENELFGHERAAYTGAASFQAGLVAEAEGGTLLLDEVDCLPPAAQVKLLRFLQQKEYRPLGSPKTRTADLRLIAATNTDVDAAMARGTLRRDLYYRLNVLPLALPPLRRRREDIPLLARHFLAEHARVLGQPCPALPPQSVRLLLEQDWPGNVRELQHVMERAVVIAGKRGWIRPMDMLLEGAEQREPLSFKEAKALAVARFEKHYLTQLLEACHGNITRASRAARKNRRAFWELLRKHHIDAARFRPPGSG